MLLFSSKYLIFSLLTLLSILGIAGGMKETTTKSEESSFGTSLWQRRLKIGGNGIFTRGKHKVKVAVGEEENEPSDLGEATKEGEENNTLTPHKISESSYGPDSEILMPNNIDKIETSKDSHKRGDKNKEIEEVESSEITTTSHEIESHGEEVNENGIEPQGKKFHILENGKYSLDGKMSIKNHIELSYLNKNYEAEMAAESLKICDKIENLKNKYEQKIAQGTEKQKMELEKIKAALKNAQNYCANEFKQKHIEKIFLFMHRIGIILLKYRIAKGHHHSNIVRLKTKEEMQNEKDYCKNFVNKLKEDETYAEKAMKILFELAKKNCSPEMMQLRAEMDPFCKGENGNKSQLGKWIEANFVENTGKDDEEAGIDVDVRHKLHRRLANYCAFIEMSSLDIGIFWCKKHKKYKTSKGKPVLVKQIEKQEPEYKNEMENICNRIEKLGEYEQSAGELLRKISPDPPKEGSVAGPEYSAANEFLEKISLNVENSILKDLLKISPEQADQMVEITANCEKFKEEDHHQSEILPEGKEKEVEDSPTHPSTSATSNKHVH